MDMADETCMFLIIMIVRSVNPSLLLIIQLTLLVLSNMLIYTAVFEFICSQCPHSMKGLLLYAIRGSYQLCAFFLVIRFSKNNCLCNGSHFLCIFLKLFYFSFLPQFYNYLFTFDFIMSYIFKC